MKFAQQMWQIANELKKLGHSVILPEGVEEYIKGELNFIPGTLSGGEGAKRKKEHDLIKKHYQEIQESDAILVVNYHKPKIKNYIGANTFLEMGFAHVLGKKIFLLNSLPQFDFYLEEILAMEPIVINGNLNQIK